MKTEYLISMGILENQQSHPANENNSQHTIVGYLEPLARLKGINRDPNILARTHIHRGNTSYVTGKDKLNYCG